MVYAVIDTNIFVSALITHNSNASTARVLESLFLHRITPLYNEDIIKEYDEVLHRAKFNLSDDQINTVIELVKLNGIDSSRFPYDGVMPDEDDRVFYEVCLSKEDSFLVTGNLKHFPKEPQVITAAEMMKILDKNYKMSLQQVSPALVVGDTCNHANEVVSFEHHKQYCLRAMNT